MQPKKPVVHAMVLPHPPKKLFKPRSSMELSAAGSGFAIAAGAISGGLFAGGLHAIAGT